MMRFKSICVSVLTILIFLAAQTSHAQVWTNLGAGLNDLVNALAVGTHGELYAGGYFTTAGGVSASKIAKWDPATVGWTNLGAGMNGTKNKGQVYTLHIAIDKSKAGWDIEGMSRPLRIDRAGGWYHVMARGINRQRIFLDDIDRRHWLGLLTELVGRFRTRIHAYALLDNHYHMIIETLEPNLSRTMQWLQTSYSMWHNRRHGRIGPLFQGRFRSVVVEDGSWGYELSVYVHLNPLQLEKFRLSRKQRKAGRKGLDRPPTAAECRQLLEKLRNYRWSSYRAYAGYEQTPKWLTTREILRRSGGEEKYRQAAQGRLSEGTDEGVLERLRDGVALGSEAFRRRVAAIGREKGREIAGRREFNPRVPYEEMIKMAEKLTREKLEDNLKRRRSTVKPLVMWASRKACGFTLREIGERLGGMDYNAVSMALHRWEVNLERSPATAAIAMQLMLMCKV